MSDQIINFKNLYKSKNSKGQDRVKFSIEKEDAIKLAEQLVDKSESFDQLYLDIHIAERTNSNDGTKFYKPYGFIAVPKKKPVASSGDKGFKSKGGSIKDKLSKINSKAIE
jgi:hypothetical protein